MSNTAPIGSYRYTYWFFESLEVMVHTGAPERFFYRVRNSMCSFWWDYSQLEIRPQVKHFRSNTALKTQFLSFLTDNRWFLTRMMPVWLQISVIFGISTKNCVYLRVFEFVSTIFFQVKLLLQFPWGICEKMNFVKTSILLLIQ